MWSLTPGGFEGHSFLLQRDKLAENVPVPAVRDAWLTTRRPPTLVRAVRVERGALQFQTSSPRHFGFQSHPRFILSSVFPSFPPFRPLNYVNQFRLKGFVFLVSSISSTALHRIPWGPRAAKKTNTRLHRYRNRNSLPSPPHTLNFTRAAESVQLSPTVLCFLTYYSFHSVVSGPIFS